MNIVKHQETQIIESKELTLLDRYKKDLIQNNFNKGTIEKYIDVATKFTAYLDERGLHITESRKEHISGYLSQFTKISAHTWNNYLTYLRQYYKFLEGATVMPDFTRVIRRKKVDRKFYKKSLPENVIKELYDYFESRVEVVRKSENKKLSLEAAMRDVAFLGILISLGSRAGKTTKILVGDLRNEITSKGNIPCVGIGDKGKATKTFRPIPHFVFEAIERYMQETKNFAKENYLFRSVRANNKSNRPVSYAAMRKRIDDGFIALGIKNVTIDRYLITPHSLRHSLGEILQQKYGTEYVQKFYNHSTISITQMYTGRNDEKRIFENPPDVSGMYGIE